MPSALDLANRMFITRLANPISRKLRRVRGRRAIRVTRRQSVSPSAERHHDIDAGPLGSTEGTGAASADAVALGWYTGA